MLAQDSANQLSVAVGKTVLVDTAQPIARVSMGLGTVAVATAVSPTEIMVNGRAPGETSLILWDIKGGRQFFNVSVHSSDAGLNEALQGVRRELHLELPQQPVRVSMEGGSVFLRGTVNDLTSSDRAVKIASTAGKVVNLLDVRVPDSKAQILLKVRFASVDRQLETQLGINFFDLGLGNAVGGITTGQFSPPSVSGAGVATSGSQGVANAQGSASFVNELNLLGFFPGLKSGAALQALETQGLVQLLAEPNLLASDGKEASFLAGGEFPYPVVQGTSSGSAAVTIEFKDYGIRLNFIPTITPRGTIRLQVAPEVSALDYSNEVQISGFTVPGITTRNVNTEVELKDRQSFVIGGLLDNSISQTFEKIPFLGDIPILGKFFQSIQRTKNNSELIVIVTPEIVPPIPAGAPLPQLHYPVPYMSPNSKIPMHTPDNTAVAQPPSPPTIPVEKLVDSMKPEQPLIIPSTSGTFGSGGTSFGGSASGASAPQQ
ncbi:MAG: type II and III secretion system protein family protein [Acidobacteriota bacterium]